MDLKKALFVCLLLYYGISANSALPEHSSMFGKTNMSEQAKGIRISGTITDKDKNPLPGVNVRVLEQTGTGVITDMDGHFYLDVPGKNSVIEISYIGFKTQQIKVGSKINFDVILEEDIEALDEVVVTGYGSQKKMSVIGSIETLQPKKLQVGATRSLSNNLAGQIAGVIAVQRSGEPGYDSSNFWIRGIASFSGGQSPLVLVDGIERDLNNIDPAEIESFSVLKDASASAMYGVRGANGVIVINTKRGKVGAPSVNLRVEHSIAEPTKLPDFIGAADHMTLINEITENKSRLPFSQEQIDRTRYGYDRDLYPDVNWLDEITKDYAYSTRANLTVSGGSDFLRYSLVGSYFGEKGIMETDKSLPYDTGTKLTRYNMRANVDLDVTKTTVLRLNVGGFLQTHRKQAFSTDDAFDRAFITSPFVYPARYSDGTIPIMAINDVNPWAAVTQRGYDVVTASQIQSLFAIEQNLKMITPGLKAKVTFSFDRWNQSSITRGKDATYHSIATGRDIEGNLIHSVLKYGDESLGHGNKGEYGNSRVYFEGTLTYARTFGKHDVDALFLYNQQSYDNGSVQPYRKQGIAGRLSYTFDSRYVTEFNFGYNGSEKFDKGHRWGFFPSFGLGWSISNEDFWTDNLKKVVSKLKLRATYGLVGNDEIGKESQRFFYLSQVTIGGGDSFSTGYEFNGRTRKGVKISNYPNSEIGWEIAYKTNLGVELGLFDGKVDIMADFFKERRTNILQSREDISTSMGLWATPDVNVGEANGKGIDISIDYNHSFHKDLWMVGRANFTYAKSTYRFYEEPDYSAIPWKSKMGMPISQKWGYVAERLFIDDADVQNSPRQDFGEYLAGDIKYKDINNDGVINEIDMVPIGYPTTPEINYGFGLSFGYKNFDLSVFFQGSARSSFWIDADKMSPFNQSTANGRVIETGLAKFIADDHWSLTSQNPKAYWPRLSNTLIANNNQRSTQFMQDGSFLRFKSAEIGYTLPKSFTNKMRLTTCRFYASGTNLLLFSKFKLWDVEMGGNGLGYPIQRVINLGLNLSF